MGFFDFNTKTIGVDPGSQNLRLVCNDVLVFNEAAEFSMNSETGKVTGYGNESLSSGGNKVFRPVSTVIADFHQFEKLLRGAVKRGLNERGFFSGTYRMYFSIPISATEIEKRAYRDSGEHAGSKEVFLLHQPCSLAIGMGLLFTKKNFILVDFSASKVEITVFANSIPIAEGVIRLGTWKLQNALRNFILRNYKLSLSEEESKQLLINLSSIGDVYKINHTSIPVSELKNALSPYFAIIEDQILETLEQASSNPQINKIISNGLYFTGGGSNINWITEIIALKGKMDNKVSSNPFLDNINGVKEVIKFPSQYKGYLMS